MTIYTVEERLNKLDRVVEAAKKLRHVMRYDYEEHPLEFIEFDVALLELEQKE